MGMSTSLRLGAFVVSTLAMLAIGTFLIGDRQFLFSSTYRVTTTFKTVSGLMEGAEVRVGGIRKGVVRRIQLPAQSNGDMVVLMDLDRSTRAVVRSDSVASISTEGLMGNKFVEISFGSPDAPVIASNGSIVSEPALDMSDLMKKTDAVLETTKQTMSNVEDISAKIDGGSGTMGALVNDKQVYERLNQATTQATQGAAAFKDDMDALKHNFFLRGFFNDRGYEDPAELTAHLITTLPREAALKTFHFDAKTMFADMDHAKLKDERAMNDAGHFLERTPFGLVVVVASGGLKGDSSQLHTLLQARATVIRDYLVRNFRMDDTRVKTMEVGKGPDATSDTGGIDVLVYAKSAAQSSHPGGGGD